MRVLIVGSEADWMGIHLRQFAAGFEQNGHHARLADYRKMERSRLPFGLSRAAQEERRHRSLRKIVHEFRPDLLIFVLARPRFHFAAIREFYKGLMVVYDFDGPGWKCYESLEWIADVDLLCTVSRVSQQQLAKCGIQSFYLPHGVDVDYYRPLRLPPAEAVLYASPVAFVGRPTPRRVRFLEGLADFDLTLWGRRWSKKSDCPSRKLRKLARSPRDIIGEGIVKIYSVTDLFVNVLREPLHDPPTIMSLQVFSVPSSGTCLLTEWVEELEEAFEPGKELLSFRTEQDCLEAVMKLHRDKAALRAIGQAGRRRCEAHHTHARRASDLLEHLNR